VLQGRKAHERSPLAAVGRLGRDWVILCGRRNSKRGMNWMLNGIRCTPLRENHKAGETANGKVGVPNQ
jgi:hypothetical protein